MQQVDFEDNIVVNSLFMVYVYTYRLDEEWPADPYEFKKTLLYFCLQLRQKNADRFSKFFHCRTLH